MTSNSISELFDPPRKTFPRSGTAGLKMKLEYLSFLEEKALARRSSLWYGSSTSDA